MIIVWALSWWYGAGWKARLFAIREKLAASYDYFSIDLLAKTMFSPFRQISAGRVSGPIGAQIRAFFDRLISRIIGSIVRTLAFGSSGDRCCHAGCMAATAVRSACRVRYDAFRLGSSMAVVFDYNDARVAKARLGKYIAGLNERLLVVLTAVLIIVAVALAFAGLLEILVAEQVLLVCAIEVQGHDLAGRDRGGLSSWNRPPARREGW